MNHDSEFSNEYIFEPEITASESKPEKRKIIKPHYKEKWEAAERTIAFQWRIIIGLIVISLAIGAFAMVIMLNLK